MLLWSSCLVLIIHNALWVCRSIKQNPCPEWAHSPSSLSCSLILNKRMDSSTPEVASLFFHCQICPAVELQYSFAGLFYSSPSWSWAAFQIIDLLTLVTELEMSPLYQWLSRSKIIQYLTAPDSSVQSPVYFLSFIIYISLFRIVLKASQYWGDDAKESTIQKKKKKASKAVFFLLMNSFAWRLQSVTATCFQITT